MHHTDKHKEQFLSEIQASTGVAPKPKQTNKHEYKHILRQEHTNLYAHACTQYTRVQTSRHTSGAPRKQEARALQSCVLETSGPHRLSAAQPAGVTLN